MKRRFDRLKRSITLLVDDYDAFSLRTQTLLATNADLQEAAQKIRFQFDSDERKIKAFQEWLQEQIDEGLLEVSEDVENILRPWTASYVTSAYRAGILRAYIDANKKDLAKADSFNGPIFTSSKVQFLNQAFNSQAAVARLELLSTRTFEQLKGVTADMAGRMSRVLTDGLAHGRNPKEIARSLVKEVEGISRGRANMIARTEIIHAYAEGQLDSLQALGIEEVSALVEWLTASNPCPTCAAMAGTVMTIAQARGLIPRHPRCRCAWIPADPEVSHSRKQIKARLERSIKRSLKAERPKATPKDAKAKSKWQGADRV